MMRSSDCPERTPGWISRAPVLPSVPGTSDEDAELEALQKEMELLGA